MGFFSFHEKYYRDALTRLEGGTLGKRELYEAKQLLKLLDDLVDEGYPQLHRILEEKYGVVSRLRNLLRSHNETPFPLQQRVDSKVSYCNAEVEVEEVCNLLYERMKRKIVPSKNEFLTDLRNYCASIEQKRNTAYVFLLRDAFLPFLSFHTSGRSGLYPWVINRDFLWKIAGKGSDDLLRLPVFEALESGVSNEREFFAFCKVRILKTLDKFPELKRTLKDLLSNIREEKILVIESGYCATIPLTLSALDERVDFRLFTTAPFLYEIYRDKIFCRQYEKIRSFETLYAQDALMKFSSFRNGRFSVLLASDDEIWERAAGEAISLIKTSS